jgi:hypothetical protein
VIQSGQQIINGGKAAFSKTKRAIFNAACGQYKPPVALQQVQGEQ